METKKPHYTKNIKTLEQSLFHSQDMKCQFNIKDGIVKEHISTRTHAGFFDVSHMGQFFLKETTTH